MMERNKKFFKQIRSSFFFKVTGLGISFLLTRLMLDYLGIEKYGMWSVILSFVNWVIYFDLGIANGIKNKVAESLANENFQDAREFISTGYVVLLLFSIVVYSSFYVISNFINWQTVFNLYSIDNNELIMILRIILFFILLNFILSIINAVFSATQKASLIVVNQFITNLLALFAVLILIYFTNSNNLLNISFSYGFTLVLSNALMTIYFYKKNSNLKPAVKSYRNSKVKSISTLGFKFFLLQLTILFILTTDRFIITQLLGPGCVTKYDILYKYFGALLIIHSIINTPLWSMYTEAYVKKDHEWLSKTLLKMIKLSLGYLLLLIVMIVFADFVMKLWINNPNIELNLTNYIYMSVMILLLAWYSIFAYFSNGIEKVGLQFYASLTGAFINIPLSILFVKYFKMDLNGVLLATISSLLIYSVLGPINAFKEIRRLKNSTIN